jgi:branched-chain amino acid transport system permease protein
MIHLLAMQLLISGLLLGGVYALLSIGLTLIMGVMRLVSFCHGDIVMVGMYIAYFIFTFLNIDPYISIIVVIPITFIIGLLIFRVVLKPTIGKPHIVQVFATLGISMIIQNVALIICTGNYRTIKTAYGAMTLKLGTLTFSVPRVIAFIVAMVFASILFRFYGKS